MFLAVEHGQPFRVMERRRPGAGDPLWAERREEGPQPSKMDISGVCVCVFLITSSEIKSVFAFVQSKLRH
jgi:hypothetical protein